MNHRIIKTGFREPRFIRKEGEDELDETIPLVVGNLRFSNEHFLAGKERRARQRYRQGYQTHPDGRFFGRIGPTELSFSVPPWPANTSGGQQKHGGRPVFHPDAHHAMLAWACHISTRLTCKREIPTITFSWMLVCKTTELASTVVRRQPRKSARLKSGEVLSNALNLGPAL